MAGARRPGPLVFAAVMSLLAGAVQAQPAGGRSATGDPYTRGEATRMAAAGYASFGPFAWSAADDTLALRHKLGLADLLLVETRHFKLAITLAPRPAPRDTRTRRAFTAELKLLRAKLPRVPRRPQTLDRWLLLHLYAHRLETTYAQVSKLLGVTDADFPQGDGARMDEFMGEGPFLGQRAKFCVILFDHNTQLKRYLTAYARWPDTPPIAHRHLLPKIGSLAFATASEGHDGALIQDADMHAHVVGAVAKNLVTGYKSHLIKLPVWWVEGLGHWYSRAVDERLNLLDLTIDPSRNDPHAWNWAARVRARVEHGVFPKCAELFDRPDVLDWKIQEHMMAWSRFEFLLRRDPGGVRRFLDALEDGKRSLLTANGPQARDVQRAALKAGWKLSFDEFDAAWRREVLDRYPRSRH